MTGCWSEGELRAFIDRELSPEITDRVAAHLEECSECGDLWAELAGRAKRVSALMDELAQPQPVAMIPRMPRRAASKWRWAGAAAALAAGLLMGLLALPKRTPEVAVTPSAGNSSQPAPVETAIDRAEPRTPAVTLATARPARVAPASRRKRPAAATVEGNAPFLALDDEPIESGVVWRVELGPREVPADVIVDAAGRPRAIRLVNAKSNPGGFQMKPGEVRKEY